MTDANRFCGEKVLDSNPRIDPSQLDRQAIARVRRGEIDAFEQLVLRYQGPLFRFVGNMLGPSHRVEDLVQEVFLSAFRHLKKFDAEKAAFSTWLFAIARNKTLNECKKRQPVTMDRLPEVADLKSPLKDVMLQQAFDHLDRVIAQMPPKERTVFLWAEIETMTYAQIAAIEQIPVGTVKSRLSRARARVRRALGRLGEITDA